MEYDRAYLIKFFLLAVETLLGNYDNWMIYVS